METCMNSNASYNCSEAAPVFNVSQPSWCLASTTDEPSTTITDIITTLVSNAKTSLFTEPTTSNRDEPSTTITDIITTLVSNATTSLADPTTSSRVPMTTVTERPVTVTTKTPGGGEGGALNTGEIIGIVAAVAAVFVIIIIIVLCWKKKENQSECPAASELHCDDPQMTLQNQTSTVGLIGKDEPDGGGIKTNSKENETNQQIVEIEKGGESKDGCNVEFKKAPIILTTDL